MLLDSVHSSLGACTRRLAGSRCSSPLSTCCPVFCRQRDKDLTGDLSADLSAFEVPCGVLDRVMLFREGQMVAACAWAGAKDKPGAGAGDGAQCDAGGFC